MRAILVSHAYVSRASRAKLRALNALGCTVAAAVPARWPDPDGRGPTITEWTDDGGVGIVPIPVRGDASEPGRVRWDGRSLRRLFKDFRPDIVQVEEEPWSRAAARSVAEARRLRIPVVGFTRTSLPVTHGLAERIRRRSVLRTAAGAIAATPLAGALLAQARPGLPLAVIPQLGVAPASVASRVDGPLSLGFMGRLVPEKGLDVLFRACVKVLGDWTLDVVGTGPSLLELEALAERLGISARVTWHGALPRADLAPVWDGINCLVAPSRATRDWVEIEAPAVVEAMGRGIPVVASDTGALRHVVGSGGIVVPEDDPTLLADALRMLLDDPAERVRLGGEGRRRVMAEFTGEALARRQLEFWRSLPA
jgi:glycosyltransferase involved in cell wall biosynthesis